MGQGSASEISELIHVEMPKVAAACSSMERLGFFAVPSSPQLYDGTTHSYRYKSDTHSNWLQTADGFAGCWMHAVATIRWILVMPFSTLSNRRSRDGVCLA